MMIEPTESESLAELDRFCDAMIAIKAEEIRRDRERRAAGRDDNPLKHAPHTATVGHRRWLGPRPYSPRGGRLPGAQWTARATSSGPPVGRIDNVGGDRNLVCDCAPLEAYASETAAVGS